ncbi:acetolactate decarboxylase [Chlamydiota bacterium]
MKKYNFLIIFLLSITINGCVHTSNTRNYNNKQDTLFQVSTIKALMEGVYEGAISCGDLKKHGDIGIGTFEALDGEMVVLGGKIYKAGIDGKVYSVPDSIQTPFAVVTHFEQDDKLKILNIESIKHLKQVIDKILPSNNYFYAIKINGTFNFIKTRSVPKQNKPYPPLTKAIKNQSVFEFNNIRGTIVGIWCPEYMKDINVTGYHFHFLSKDKTKGGHLLECNVNEANIEIDYTTDFFMVIPKDSNQ